MYILDFPVSLLRSFIFLSFGAVQNFLHRKINSTNLLLNSFIVVLLISPNDFLSVGCILSFAAVAGIFYFYKPLLNEFKKIPFSPLHHLWQHVCMSLSAGIFTLPLILIWFNGFSYSSIIANAILVPLSGLVMPLLAGGLALGVATNGKFMYFAYLGKQATSFFIFLTEYFSNYSFYLNYNSLICLPFVINLILTLTLLILQKFYNFKFRMDLGRRLLISILFFCVIMLSPFAGYLENLRFAK